MIDNALSTCDLLPSREVEMPAAHPVALRERVVKAYKASEGTFAELAERFDVGEASVNRWVSLERRTGSVAPRPAGGSRRPWAITPEALDYMLSLIADEPMWTTTELANELAEVLDIKGSRHTVGRALRSAGLTSKRGSHAHQHPGARES